MVARVYTTVTHRGALIKPGRRCVGHRTDRRCSGQRSSRSSPAQPGVRTAPGLGSRISLTQLALRLALGLMSNSPAQPGARTALILCSRRSFTRLDRNGLGLCSRSSSAHPGMRAALMIRCSRSSPTSLAVSSSSSFRVASFSARTRLSSDQLTRVDGRFAALLSRNSCERRLARVIRSVRVMPLVRSSKLVIEGTAVSLR